ncbi:MAG: outer membrane protein assembly factor BamA [Alphaproteobacteria bacterium]|nr:outer membrane protein assembly factor BamA [Alphaproteobacteria bacterium]
MIQGKLNRAFILTLCFAVATICVPFAAQAAQQTIKKIQVNGAQRVEASTVLSYMDLKSGDQINSEKADQALKSLFATGLFADVKLNYQDGTLNVNVIENPLINKIAFEGNDKIKDEELLSEIQLRPRQVFTRTKVQSDVSRLYQIYRRQGRFSVNIEPKVIELDQNRVNLVFEIQEGDVTKVESIRFVGNRHYSDDKLRSAISTKESAWYRFLSSDDRYDPDRLSYDQELLRNFYLSQGYADFQILSADAELSDDRKGFFITFTLEEGNRYKVSGTEVVSHIRNLEGNTLNKEVKLEEGDWYNADKVRESVTKITDALGDLQYAFVDVQPDIQRDRENKLVKVVFTINETPRVFVERININGNVRTLDKVVRREMMLAEGDPFNRSRLARSEKNIKDLDYFENVDVNVKPGSAPDRTVVDVDVAEKSTGELSVGAGFSTSDGPLADLRIREKNLLGKGQDLLFATTVAGRKTEFNVSFTEPYFLNRDLSAGVDLFHMTRDLQNESSYDQKRTGGALRFGFPLSENWRQTWRYTLERNEILNVSSSASRFIRDQEGRRDTSAVSQRLTYDNRDSVVFPTSGWNYWLETELAGLGGDAKYVSGKTGASFYYPVRDQWVLNVLGETGAIGAYSDANVEINERYTLGGSSFRGFRNSGIGPRDATTADALGGNYFYRGTVEMAFPLGFSKELGIRGHAFSDFGSLWNVDETGVDVQDENSLRASAGLGVSWRSPFGPIRLDYAVPYAKQSYDEEEHFRVDFGTRF